MKNIKIIFTILSVILLAWSCEEYLDEPNPNAPELLEAVNNLEDTEKVLNGVYNSLFNHFLLSIEEDNYRSDIGSMRNRITPNVGLNEHLDYYFKTVNPSTRRVDQRWGALYRGIFFANQALAALDQIRPGLEGDDLDEWNLQRAQALFFRGTYHFYLHSVFNEGKIIIRDGYEPDVTKRHKDVSSSEEVIAFFRKDLEEAIEYLPMPSEITELGRVSKGAATMILANSYLYEGTQGGTRNMVLINQAMQLYESLRDDFGYALETEVNPIEGSMMFTTAGEFNSESIFEINYTTDFGLELNEFDERSPHNRLASRGGHFNFRGQDFMQPATWLMLAYEEEPIDPSNPINTVVTGDGNQDTRRVSLRASNMIFLNDDLDTPVYGGPNAMNAGRFTGLASRNLTITAFKKYTNHDLGVPDEQATGSSNRLKSGKNAIVNRLSEVLLNLAECYIYNGRVQDAINEINKIRNRWALMPLDINSQLNNDGVPYDETSLMEHLMFIEKPLELSVEGHATRVIDLRRWGVASQRFNDLSQQFYRGTFYPKDGRRIVTPELARGPLATITRALSDIETIPLSEVPADADTRQQRNIFNEFPLSATNYSNNNGYLPIPAEEDINNNEFEN
ncbi:RagB/SusD family nutrient uptake outer membrane protein [Flavivirga rizhaonensis]|uniref:RagB/SusD family nutrient uptake outer membrane protein n=1 Tax=Flavivirga rizhaonensis TaxID=2559571 RepID=A0A4S1DSR7_9FLAO|nr:RagB/SusD family nutrient uptake outer membrane protein [Flavivirga rizhaonensis]TGV00785.1 RagB/SusD family nutrient uptake outer membrane protein [Flavivirga rizhaonensis]